MNPDKGEILHYIKGLLYASAMNSNYYQSSDFNVNYEFDCIIVNRSIRNLEQHKIDNWKIFLKEKLTHWLFKHMPANTLSCNWYVKDFLIAEIIRNIEKIVSKNVHVFEIIKSNAANEGFEVIFDDEETSYYMLIELNDSFVKSGTVSELKGGE